VSKNKDKIKNRKKEWSKNNLHKLRANVRKREAAKLNATPKWLTKEHLLEIQNIYMKSIELKKIDGIQRHVDHIVPLQGANVCGLHVPWNLQILSQQENLSKSNK
jgi:5-methylcytosine-specific restriction endonuclease McrA